MGGPLKCKLKEGGGRIIRSFYKYDVVAIRPLERIPNARYAKRVYKVSIAFLGKYRTTVNANCIELAIIEACRLLLSAKKRSG